MKRVAQYVAGAIVLIGCYHPGTVSSPSERSRLPRTILARPELLLESRRLVQEHNVFLYPAYRALIHDADSALTAAPISVIQKKTTPPSGDKHDFLSLAPYWWPDSTKPGGLPYVRRDGEMNPQSRIDHDGLRFLAMTDMVESLALAYWFTGEKRYARRAAYFVRVFFLEPATKMNPNLRYAQAIMGVTDGRGIGILDTRHMPRVLDAIRLIDSSGEWTAADERGFQQWCRTYLAWLKESANGKDERSQKNNHGTLYDMQVASLALFVGDKNFAHEILGPEVRARIDSQILPDGSQPLELERTRPIHYSLFNLDAFTQLAEMGRHVGSDLWHYRSAKGSSIGAALRFIAPYADGTKQWSKPDITPIAPEETSIDFRRGTAALNDSILERAIHATSGMFPMLSRELLFYPGIGIASLGDLDSLTSHALGFARARLKSSAISLDQANGFPRSTRPNGTWDQRPSNQWTSGFFAGTLWYMYQLDRSEEWKSLADRWTRGLEPAKAITTTHDLGFIIYNSFGHGFLLTGDTAYRRVVIDASRSLATRYSPTVHAIKSWDTDSVTDARRGWEFPVIIDNLMNLEMLFAASRWGDKNWKDIAQQHALTSAAAHVRGDGSTAHVVLFNPQSGRVEKRVTWQGFDDNSVWARGQAWAIYGFTTAYRNTGKPGLLVAAQNVANLFIHLDAPNGVPWWDLRMPLIPNAERDASAAAIAASGLLDLARQSRGESARRYREVAERIIRTLSAEYLTEGVPMASILEHSVGSRPQSSEVDVGLVYADYYFVEALLRLRGIYLQ